MYQLSSLLIALTCAWYRGQQQAWACCVSTVGSAEVWQHNEACSNGMYSFAVVYVHFPTRKNTYIHTVTLVPMISTVTTANSVIALVSLPPKTSIRHITTYTLQEICLTSDGVTFILNSLQIFRVINDFKHADTRTDITILPYFSAALCKQPVQGQPLVMSPFRTLCSINEQEDMNKYRVKQMHCLYHMYVSRPYVVRSNQLFYLAHGLFCQ